MSVRAGRVSNTLRLVQLEHARDAGLLAWVVRGAAAWAVGGRFAAVAGVGFFDKISGGGCDTGFYFRGEGWRPEASC